jgi:membrane protein DedA with SNARE-associated domain
MLTTIITNLYISTGLLGIVLAMALESCCIPLPSEIVLPIAGLLFAQHKLLPGTETYLGIVLLGLSGSIGCVVGSMIAYWIGYKGGRPLMLRYGRYVLISQHDADKADAFFQRWGSPTAFFSRLLPVVRTYISLPAGITKMPFVRFCIYSFCGSLPWCILLAYAGVVLQNNMTVIEPIYKDVEYVVLVAIVVLVVLYVWRHLLASNKYRPLTNLCREKGQERFTLLRVVLLSFL